MSKNTPGPWCYRSDDKMILADFGKQNWHIAQIQMQGRETEFNASLIAAAPDLLAALEALVPADMLEHPHDFGPDWHAARRAIARAKGEA